MVLSVVKAIKKLIEAMQENSLSVGVISLTELITTKLSAASGSHLEIVAAKDIIVTLGDNAGAQKVSFADSDDSEVGSLDSEGNLDLDGVVTPAGGIVHVVDTGEYTIPDNSECIAAFGAADAVGAGFMGVIIDTGNNKTYLAVSNGSAYQIFEGAAAAT